MEPPYELFCFCWDYLSKLKRAPTSLSKNAKGLSASGKEEDARNGINCRRTVYLPLILQRFLVHLQPPFQVLFQKPPPQFLQLLIYGPK